MNPEIPKERLFNQMTPHAKMVYDLLLKLVYAESEQEQKEAQEVLSMKYLVDTETISRHARRLIREPDKLSKALMEVAKVAVYLYNTRPYKD